MGGSSSVACADIRVGLAESKSLRYLNLNHTMFPPIDMIPILGTLIIYNLSLYIIYYIIILYDTYIYINNLSLYMISNSSYIIIYV